MTRCSAARLAPDPRRVITRPFVPREEIDGSARVTIVLRRIVAMAEAEVDELLAGTRQLFAGRHRDLDEIFDRSFDVVAPHLADVDRSPDTVSTARRRLIGAYFTQEYSIEAAALANPSIVASPDQSALAAGDVRFVMSLRSIGEGHTSSIQFRTGVIGSDGGVEIDEPSGYAVTGAPTPEHPGSAPSGYGVTFPTSIPVSERVLFPSVPAESHGMEDARFVRFVDDDASVTYYATYTAYDGHRIGPQLIQTGDFSEFRVTTLTGRAARNKGIALFPRRIGGAYVALGRHDNVNNYVMRSDDVRVWDHATLVQEPRRPWELMQLGNCGSPIETAAGWLVITHGVGPVRRYTLGALLLDLDHPTRVIGHLREPLLSPESDEREGYVPNVVYSCGSMIHGDHLVLPYGFADAGTGVATIPVARLLDRLEA